MNESSKSRGSSLGIMDSFTMKGASGDNFLDLGMSGPKPGSNLDGMRDDGGGDNNHKTSLINPDPEEMDAEADVTQPSFHVDNADLDELDADFSDFEDNQSDNEDDNDKDEDRSGLSGAVSAATATTDDARYMTANSKLSGATSQPNSQPASQATTPLPLDFQSPIFDDKIGMDNHHWTLTGNGNEFGIASPKYNPFESTQIEPHPMFNFSAQEMEDQRHMQSLFEDDDFQENVGLDNEEIFKEAEKENLEEHRFLQEDAMKTSVAASANTSTWTVSDQPSRVERPSWIPSNQPKLSKSELFGPGSSGPLGSLNEPEAEGPSLGMGAEFGRFATRKSPDLSLATSGGKMPEFIDDIESDGEDDLSISSVPTRTSSAERCISTPLPSNSTQNSQIYKLPIFSCVSEVTETTNLFGAGSPGRSRSQFPGLSETTANPLLSLTAIQKFISGGPNASRLIDLLSKTNTLLQKQESDRVNNKQQVSMTKAHNEDSDVKAAKPVESDPKNHKENVVPMENVKQGEKLGVQNRELCDKQKDCEQNAQRTTVSAVYVPEGCSKVKDASVVAQAQSEDAKFADNAAKEDINSGDPFAAVDLTGTAMKRPYSANDASTMLFESTVKEQTSSMSMSDLSMCTESSKLECNRSMVTFGCAETCSSVSQTVQIKNTSKKSIMKINCGIASDNQAYQVYFSGLCPPPQLILYPFEIKTIDIIFRPSQVKMYSDSLTLTVANTNEKYKIPLLGYGGCAEVYFPDSRSKTRPLAGIVPGSSANIRVRNSGHRDAFIVCRATLNCAAKLTVCTKNTVLEAGKSTEITVIAAKTFTKGCISVVWGEDLLRKRLKRLAKQMGNEKKWHAYTSDFDYIDGDCSVLSDEPPIKSSESRLFFGALRTCTVNVIPRNAQSSHSQSSSIRECEKSKAESKPRTVLAAVNRIQSVADTNNTNTHTNTSATKKMEVIDDLGRVLCMTSRVVFSKTSCGAWDSVKVEFRNVSRLAKQLEFKVVSGPFTLKKFKDRVLEPMKFIRIPVYFQPEKVGHFEGSLRVTVEGGTQLMHVPLIGEAI